MYKKEGGRMASWTHQHFLKYESHLEEGTLGIEAVMKHTLPLSFCFATVKWASAHPAFAHRDDPYGNWAPAGPDDLRAPCPMLNTLANHGFLNHNGSGITQDQLTSAFDTYLNLDPEFSEAAFKFALTTMPNPNATTLDLDALSRHGILEHDGSLSRLDAYFGNNHVFDESTFEQTKSYWTSDIIDLQQAANARLARMYVANATNPTFNLSQVAIEFSFGETAIYMLVFGNRDTQQTNRTWIEYFFENERLPTSLGWHTQTEQLTIPVVGQYYKAIINATSGTYPYPVPSNATASGPPENKRSLKPGNLHAGTISV